MHKAKSKHFILTTGIILLVAVGLAGLFLYRLHSKTTFSGNNPQTDDGKMANDLLRLSAEDYEAVLLSMHSPDQFQEEDFSSFRELNTFVTSQDRKSVV